MPDTMKSTEPDGVKFNDAVTLAMSRGSDSIYSLLKVSANRFAVVRSTGVQVRHETNVDIGYRTLRFVEHCERLKYDDAMKELSLLRSIEDDKKYGKYECDGVHCPDRMHDHKPTA